MWKGEHLCFEDEYITRHEKDAKKLKIYLSWHFIFAYIYIYVCDITIYRRYIV